MKAETEELKEIREKSTPFCRKCGIFRLYRILILICTFTGSALLWWAFSLSTWVKIEIPGSSKVLFSALFAICKGEVTCWMPLSRSNYFIFGQIFMISALLLSFFLSFILLAFPHSLPDSWEQYFVFTITFLIIGILCFFSSHHCWLRCVLLQPIHVKPTQVSVTSGNSDSHIEETR
nr:transmembrane protein 225B-like isoform X3 [Equus asinus]